MTRNRAKINCSGILFVLIISIMISSIDANSSINRINAQKPPLTYNYELESLKKIKQINNVSNYIQNPIPHLSHFYHPMELPYLTNVSSMIEFNTKAQNQCIPLQAGTQSLNHMKSSSKLVKFITGYEGNAGLLPPLKGLEGDQYGLYNDPEGNCTVGIGHLLHFGNCTAEDIAAHKKQFPNGETNANALRILKKDLIFVEKDVKDNVKVSLTQQQFDALVDFVFNEGVDKLISSKLVKDVNSGNCDASTIQNDLLQITRGGLLIDRRNAEADIFNNNLYAGT